MENLIELNRIRFAFGERRIYDDLNLSVPQGKVSVIMGPSGCGKSTLLNFIGGRIQPEVGEVLVGGVDVAKLKRQGLYKIRRSMGMMFQNSALLTDLDVFDNVAFPVREHTELDETLIRHLVLFKLQMVGLRGARDLKPAELSGGMARRVALARAIALDPKLVMYDEPFTGLDPISKGVIVKLIREIGDALGMTSLVVTHDVAEGLSIADKVVLLGDGRVASQGTAAEMQESTDPEVRQFIDGRPDGPVAYQFPAGEYLADLSQGSAR
ncbi:ABC transporter ATP-binding protein [Gammaproteobacteria bacterium]|nr:ABC transporter ATP-binding protein [Gammaproteobacteria bacterium]